MAKQEQGKQLVISNEVMRKTIEKAGYTICHHGLGSMLEGWYALLPGEREFFDNADEVEADPEIAHRQNYLGFFSDEPDLLKEVFDEVLSIDYDDVAEWVGLHYRRNFEQEPLDKQQEWIERYIDSHVVPFKPAESETPGPHPSSQPEMQPDNPVLCAAAYLKPDGRYVVKIWCSQEPEPAEFEEPTFSLLLQVHPRGGIDWQNNRRGQFDSVIRQFHSVHATRRGIYWRNKDGRSSIRVFDTSDQMIDHIVTNLVETEKI